MQKRDKKYAKVPYYAMHFEYNNDHQKYKMNGQELMVTEEEVDTGVKVTKNLKPAGGQDGPNSVGTAMQSLHLLHPSHQI